MIPFLLGFATATSFDVALLAVWGRTNSGRDVLWTAIACGVIFVGAFAAVTRKAK